MQAGRSESGSEDPRHDQSRRQDGGTQGRSPGQEREFPGNKVILAAKVSPGWILMDAGGRRELASGVRLRLLSIQVMRFDVHLDRARHQVAQTATFGSAAAQVPAGDG